MSLKNKLKLGIAGLSLLVGLNTAKAQSIEGYVNSSGEYPRLPIVNALVSAGSLGEDFTDINGYYHIPPLFVIPPVELHPRHGTEIGYELFDILSRKVGILNRNETLEQFLSKNRLASNFYVLKANDDIGEYVQRLVIVNSNIVGQGKREYKTRNINNNVPVLNNLNNNSLKNNRSINSLYEFYVDDDLIQGEIRNYYNYLDTLDITNNESKDIRLIPRFEIGTQYYDEILDLMNDLERPYTMPPTYFGTLTNYGNYPNAEASPYPQRVWLNPQMAQQYCGSNWQTYINAETALIDSINVKTQREGLLGPVDLFIIVQDSLQANIKIRYNATGNPYWEGIETNIGGIPYLAGGTVYMRSDYTNPISIYAVFGHELGIHGLGMEGHSDDPNYISYGQVGLDFQQEEIEVIKNHVLQYNYTKMFNFIEE